MTRPLTDAEIEHYARQIIVPGIGAGGQTRLCAARIGLGGVDAELAEPYLRTLGSTVVAAGDAADCTILAGISAAARTRITESAAALGPIVWYAVASGAVTAGVASTIAELPEFTRLASTGATVPGISFVAACDAVATAAALVLGWEDIERAHHVELA
jgi:molybdopterin/thiamine biosynthesis adenylyltransferase